MLASRQLAALVANRLRYGVQLGIAGDLGPPSKVGSIEIPAASRYSNASRFTAIADSLDSLLGDASFLAASAGFMTDLATARSLRRVVCGRIAPA